MCRIANTIKLCTCNVASIAELKHYWVFYRYAKKKDLVMIGEVIMPLAWEDPEVIALNESMLLQRLQEADAFDINLSPKNKDRLLIAIRVGSQSSDYHNYGFEWQGKKWVSCPYGYFEWTWKHDEIQFGKVISI